MRKAKGRKKNYHFIQYRKYREYRKKLRKPFADGDVYRRATRRRARARAATLERRDTRSENVCLGTHEHRRITLIAFLIAVGEFRS